MGDVLQGSLMTRGDRVPAFDLEYAIVEASIPAWFGEVRAI